MLFHKTIRSDRLSCDDSALDTVSDEKLMSEIQAGSGDAFAVLFDRYHRLVLVTALRIVRDVAEAEEVTQSVFLDLYRAARQFDPAKGTLKVWLLQFAYHRSINRRNYLVLRQFYKREDLQEALDWEVSGAVAWQFAPQECARFAEQALGILNEAQRRVIEMIFFEGLTLKEVAEKTNQSFSSVRNHYYRGLDRLRVHLSSEPVTPDHEAAISLREMGRAKA
jgi:RNA polymerase sigma-70 factor (ECF subfamily)